MGLCGLKAMKTGRQKKVKEPGGYKKAICNRHTYWWKQTLPSMGLWGESFYLSHSLDPSPRGKVAVES